MKTLSLESLEPFEEDEFLELPPYSPHCPITPLFKTAGQIRAAARRQQQTPRKELQSQLTNIGSEIKRLQEMSDRFKTIRPFLRQIEELNQQDHFSPDPVLDRDISKCSGWNVAKEFHKVTNEIQEIDQILDGNSSISRGKEYYLLKVVDTI